MRALRLWTDIAEWRWTPAVGLSIAAATFVVLAVVVIPDHIGNGPSASQLSRLESLRSRGSSYTASIAPAVAEPESATPPTPSPSPPANVELAQHAVRSPSGLDLFPRRGFSPPLPRPEAAPPPPAPPPPPPPPAVVIPPPQPQAPPPAPEAPPPAPAPPPPVAEPPQAAPPAPEAVPVPPPPPQ